MEWKSVQKVQKKPTLTKKSRPLYYSREEARDQYQIVLDSIKIGILSSEYTINSAVLYGSAKSAASIHPGSDIDLMVFIKGVDKNNYLGDFKEGFKKVKAVIAEHSERKVDLVVASLPRGRMSFQNRDSRDEIFFEEVRGTGVDVYGDHFKDYIDYSVKLFKV